MVPPTCTPTRLGHQVNENGENVRVVVGGVPDAHVVQEVYPHQVHELQTLRR
jgi:hypothetical protein